MAQHGAEGPRVELKEKATGGPLYKGVAETHPLPLVRLVDVTRRLC